MEIKTSADLKIFTSKKLIVFTKQKVATRYLHNRFNCPPGIKIPDTESDVHILQDLSLGNEGDKLLGYGDNTMMYSEIFNLRNNKKDIILLYRNPLDRFITGVLQYTLKNLNPTNFSIAFDTEPMYKTEFDMLFKLSEEYLFGNIPGNMTSTFKKKKSSELFDMTMKEVTAFSESIIHRICVFLKYTTFVEDCHTENYLWVYNSILNDNRIDVNKLTLINLTDSKNSLSSILDSYIPNYESDKNFKGTQNMTTNSNGHAKSMLFDYIKNDKELYTKINNYINIDNYFYSLFEKSELNILNK